MADFKSDVQVPRKSKRQPLACIPCHQRKVKCEKVIPCRGCIERGMADRCQREVVQTTSVEKTKSTPEQPSASFNSSRGPFQDRDIEDIRTCVEMLTCGTIKVERIFRANGVDCEWPQFYGTLEHMLRRLNYESSHALCAFASHRINLLHNAVIPTLFMKEHDLFWSLHVREDPNCLIYIIPNKFQARSPQDYYYWMAMYYISLCNGAFFGCEELKGSLPFTKEELESMGPLLFKACYSCLCHARFMDSPDIRAIQIYCMMCTCFHAYGNVGLSRSLLVQMAHIASELNIDESTNSDSEVVNYELEVKRRLWYTLWLVDWLDSIKKEHCMEGPLLTFPKLITEAQLLGQTAAKVDPAGREPAQFSEVHYQNVLTRLTLIKKSMLRKKTNYREVVHAWVKMNQLRFEVAEYYSMPQDPHALHLQTFNYSGFLLFSTLTDEVLDLGRRLLSVVGRQKWVAKYRARYMEAATAALNQASGPLPAYYKRHWIVAQHLIYAALCVLLDMIMFPDEEEKHIRQEKLTMIEGVFPVFQELKAFHTPARIGLALLPKLCQLVRFNLVDKQEGNGFEENTLRQFLEDLKVTKSSSVECLPQMSQPQYLRGNMAESPVEHQHASNDLSTTISPEGYMMEDDAQNYFSESGWSSYLLNALQWEMSVAPVILEGNSINS